MFNSLQLNNLAQAHLDCDNSGSNSPMYVHYTDTACTSLTLVVQPTVHAQQPLALSTLDLPPSSPPSSLPCTSMHYQGPQYTKRWVWHHSRHCSVSDGLQLSDLAKACLDHMTTPGVTSLCMCAIYVLHKFADTCNFTHSPCVGQISFMAPWTSLPLATFLAIPTLQCMHSQGEYDIFKASFSVQQFTTQRPCPGLVELHNNSRANSSMYVHTACNLLMPVAQFTIHAGYISAL